MSSYEDFLNIKRFDYEIQHPTKGTLFYKSSSKKRVPQITLTRTFGVDTPLLLSSWFISLFNLTWHQCYSRRQLGYPSRLHLTVTPQLVYLRSLDLDICGYNWLYTYNRRRSLPHTHNTGSCTCQRNGLHRKKSGTTQSLYLSRLSVVDGC